MCLCDQYGYKMLSQEYIMNYRIRELRDMTGLSQRDFAAKYDIPLSTLRKWEQGNATPAPYVVRLIASTLPGTDENRKVIKGDDSNIYLYDQNRNMVSDSLGNEIAVSESLDGVNEDNLKLYLKDLFESFYEIQEKFNRDCRFDKKENVIWSHE